LLRRWEEAPANVATTSGVLTMLQPMWRTSRSSSEAQCASSEGRVTTTGPHDGFCSDSEPILISSEDGRRYREGTFTTSRFEQKFPRFSAEGVISSEIRLSIRFRAEASSAIPLILEPRDGQFVVYPLIPAPRDGQFVVLRRWEEAHADVATTSGALTMLRPMWLH
jgi:hypothetical protein